jgi:hypothetical protein
MKLLNLRGIKWSALADDFRTWIQHSPPPDPYGGRGTGILIPIDPE